MRTIVRRFASPRNDGRVTSSRQIGKFRISAQIIHDEAAAGDDLAAVGADQFERAPDQFGSNAAAAQRAGRFGVMMTAEGVMR